MVYPAEPEVWREILEKYRSFRFLWCKNERKKCSVDDEETAWNELIKVAQKAYKFADKAFIKQRIAVFRSGFRREKQKVKYAEKNGQHYEPKAFYYDTMKSIWDSNDSQDDSDTSETFINAQIKEEKVEKLESSSSGDESEEPSNKRARYDPAVILAKRMSEHLEKMEPEQYLLAEKIISDICVYGRLGKLTIESVVALTKN